jgi:hypothetical protein
MTWPSLSLIGRRAMPSTHAIDDAVDPVVAELIEDL